MTITKDYVLVERETLEKYKACYIAVDVYYDELQDLWEKLTKLEEKEIEEFTYEESDEMWKNSLGVVLDACDGYKDCIEDLLEEEHANELGTLELKEKYEID